MKWLNLSSGLKIKKSTMQEVFERERTKHGKAKVQKSVVWLEPQKQGQECQVVQEELAARSGEVMMRPSEEGIDWPFILFWLCHGSCKILVPQLGIEPAPSIVE